MPPHVLWACPTPATPTQAATTTQPCRLPPTRCALSIGPCACRCSRASSPHRARRCRSPARCTTPTHCSGTTGLSASRPARTTRPAAASPSGPSAGSTASGRRSPESCWASPATTRSQRVSRPPTPWSTAPPFIGLCQIYSNEPCHYELPPESASALLHKCSTTCRLTRRQRRRGLDPIATPLRGSLLGSFLGSRSLPIGDRRGRGSTRSRCPTDGRV